MRSMSENSREPERHAAADQVSVRRVHPYDGDALNAFYAGLSADARRARFLASGPGPSQSATRSFCTPDHQHEEGFVATTTDGAVVGHLCLASVGPDTMELGVAVADEWQGKGVGRQLFEAAVQWARTNGVVSIVATAFADNTRVVRLLSSAPYPAIVSWADGGVVEVMIPLVGPLPTTRSWPPFTSGQARMARSRRRCRRERLGQAPLSLLRVVWRRRQPPGRAAVGSASRESS